MIKILTKLRNALFTYILNFLCKCVLRLLFKVTIHKKYVIHGGKIKIKIIFLSFSFGNDVHMTLHIFLSETCDLPLNSKSMNNVSCYFHA